MKVGLGLNYFRTRGKACRKEDLHIFPLIGELTEFTSGHEFLLKSSCTTLQNVEKIGYILIGLRLARRVLQRHRTIRQRIIHLTENSPNRQFTYKYYFFVKKCTNLWINDQQKYNTIYPDSFNYENKLGQVWLDLVRLGQVRLDLVRLGQI